MTETMSPELVAERSRCPLNEWIGAWHTKRELDGEELTVSDKVESVTIDMDHSTTLDINSARTGK